MKEQTRLQVQEEWTEDLIQSDSFCSKIMKNKHFEKNKIYSLFIFNLNIRAWKKYNLLSWSDLSESQPPTYR